MPRYKVTVEVQLCQQRTIIAIADDPEAAKRKAEWYALDAYSLADLEPRVEAIAVIEGEEVR